MPLTPNRRLQVRIAGTLALVVAVNGLLLSILVWSASRVLSASGRSVAVEPGLPLTIGAVLLGALGLVALQARYGSRTVVSGLELEELEDEGPRNVVARVRRLAAQADVPSPSVAVADRPEPCCLTVGSRRSPTIVVTSGLLAELDDDELEAALAHEVAHVANRDLPVVTAVAATVAIGDRLLERERLLRQLLGSTVLLALFTGVGILVLAVPILLLVPIYLVVSAVARVLLAVNAIALGLFSKTREYAADRAACQLTGDPAALASALETLADDRDRPLTDARRMHASATLGIVPQPLSLAADENGADTDADEGEEHWIERWFTFSDSSGPAIEYAGDEPNVLERLLLWLLTQFRERVVVPIRTRVRRALAWRPPTHPSTAARIERLRTLERGRRQRD